MKGHKKGGVAVRRGLGLVLAAEKNGRRGGGKAGHAHPVAHALTQSSVAAWEVSQVGWVCGGQDIPW